ncbi:TetR/AcrR family transcriptional regulator [Hydrogenoanaerobacterium sp.]|uniref:TetR/AcrR family transcriptional regulator n=1 Tax=Hydrogenoanaerobacterium sp. TaxID=2953763 RepID=UPI0028A23216|nr:TetR/AcrR family transcriptional regulator [Hydrogenoanaerobacterium sp.]
MPTVTFENLPEEKKNRILEAAIDEFAEYRFSDASINRIVKAAGIPRGSFYQYFRNKEDIYMLVIEKISKGKMEIFSRAPALSEGATFFDAAIAAVPSILEWVQRCPKYDRIGMLMTQDSSEFMQHIIEQMQTAQHSVIDFLKRDQQCGLIRKDADLELVVQMFLPIMTTTLREYYSKDGHEEAIRKIGKIFDIIGMGILSEEARHERNCTAGRSPL